MIIKNAAENDLQGIIDLQEKNLFRNLSESERKNGFVTTPFTVAQLENLLERKGLFVIEIDGKIMGYTMAAGWNYFSQWPIFPHMISRLKDYAFKGTRISDSTTFQYGPVCIDADLRGTNAFPQLFNYMRAAMSSLYPIGITFINKINDRSYKAHINRLDMEVIDQFEFSDQEYYSLAFETTG